MWTFIAVLDATATQKVATREDDSHAAAGVAERKIRRTVFRHALLSYVFGTLIIGIAINVVGNLIR